MNPPIITSNFRDLRVACVQCTSHTDRHVNLQSLGKQIAEAVDKGAQFVSLPEGANLLNQHAHPDDFFHESDDPCIQGLIALACTFGCWLHIGSALVLAENSTTTAASPRLVNRTLLYDPSGTRVACYDKMHLFKLQLGDIDIDESRQFVAGLRSQVATTPWGKIGLSICYDVRYGNFFQHLCHNGAQVLAIPAAFTRPTGEAHWHMLIRARAIENACFVIAAAQCGRHADGRTTYGHSLIVDPWGTILAEANGTDPQVIVATLQASQLDKARSTLPAWRDRQ